MNGIIKTSLFHVEQGKKDGNIVYVGFLDRRKKSLYLPERQFNKFLESLFTEENIVKYSK